MFGDHATNSCEAQTRSGHSPSNVSTTVEFATYTPWIHTRNPETGVIHAHHRHRAASRESTSSRSETRTSPPSGLNLITFGKRGHRIRSS
jgi:hypothetical protein